MPTNPNITKSRRDNGEGSITLRGTRYMGRIRLNGSNYTVYGKTEREIKKKFKELKEKVILGQVPCKSTNVASYIQEWLETYKRPSLKASSYDRLERTFLLHIQNTIVGRSQIGNLCSRDIQKLINEKSSTYSYSTIKKIYELLHSCFAQAVLLKDIPSNPTDGVVLPNPANLAVKTKTIPALTVEELQRLIAVCNQTRSTGLPMYRYSQGLLLMLNTGMRAGELLALTWRQVDWNSRTIHVCQSASLIKNRTDNNNNRKYVQTISTVKTKNGDRIIPLNDQAILSLEKLKGLQEQQHLCSDFVLCTKSGNNVSIHSLRKCFDHVLKAANVDHVGTHSLRHSFASLLLNNGVDIKVVSELLGHSNTNITYNTYIHTTQTQKVNATDSLNDLCAV